jgi:hypothetical protein
MVPGERIELPTNGLQNRCSTAELTRLFNDLAFSGHNWAPKMFALDSRRIDSQRMRKSSAAFAVLRLMKSSTFVACCTGRSTGFSPLRMRST